MLSSMGLWATPKMQGVPLQQAGPHQITTHRSRPPYGRASPGNYRFADYARRPDTGVNGFNSIEPFFCMLQATRRKTKQAIFPDHYFVVHIDYCAIRAADRLQRSAIDADRPRSACC